MCTEVRLTTVGLTPARYGYAHVEADRFRHTTQFVRLRPRDPRSYTYDQLERPVRFNLADVLTGTVDGYDGTPEFS